MNLFRKRRNPAEPAENTFELAPAKPSKHIPILLREISLSAEQKSMLEKPLDPRVDRILREIYADRAAAEHALKARSILRFPSDDCGERHVVQDSGGFWRIVPGPASTKLNEFSDAL
jgi:hypothetical protein